MKSKTKKALKIGGIILGVLVVAWIIFSNVSYGRTLSFVRNVQVYEANMNVQESLTSNLTDSYIFSQSWSTNLFGTTDLDTAIPFSIAVAGRYGSCSGTMPNFPSDVSLGPFTTTNVNVNAPVGGGLNNTYNPLLSSYYKIVNQTATCQIENNIGCGYGSDFYCVYSGVIVPISPQIYVSFGIGGVSSTISGNLVIEIPKQGIQCTPAQMSACSSGQTCNSNICTSPSVTSIGVYQLQNNQCFYLQIPPSMMSSAYYPNLASCQAQIVPPSSLNTSLNTSGNGTTDGGSGNPPQTDWTLVWIGIGALIVVGIIIVIIAKSSKRRER